MSTATLLQAGLQWLETETSSSLSGVSTFEYLGHVLECLRSSEKRLVAFDTHGNEVRIDLTLHIRRELFLEAMQLPIGSTPEPLDHFPQSGDTGKYNNVVYRVITASEDAVRAFVVLELADAQSNQ